jgi:hypothetical protein
MMQICTALLCWAYLIGTAPALVPRETSYKQVVPIGIDVFRYEGLCMPIAASMSSGQFLSGLTATETPTGRRFRKGSQEVTEYPPQITINIKARVVDCLNAPSQLPNGTKSDDLAKDLRFSVAWKKQTEERLVPANNVRVSVSPHTTPSGPKMRRMPPSGSTN